MGDYEPQSYAVLFLAITRNPLKTQSKTALYSLYYIYIMIIMNRDRESIWVI